MQQQPHICRAYFRNLIGTICTDLLLVQCVLIASHFKPLKAINKIENNNIDSDEIRKNIDVMGDSNALAVVPFQQPVLARFYEDEKVFIFGDNKILIKQDWAGSGVAAVVWDAAVVLAEYLAVNTDIVYGKNVLELGAGTGLAGIAAYKLGAKSTLLTDRQLALDGLRSNLNRNTVNHCLKTVENNHQNDCSTYLDNDSTLKLNDITADVLEWGSEITKTFTAFDLVIGADIIYIEETFPLLLKTLRDLCSSERAHTVILLSCRIRYDRDERFLDMLREHFNVVQVLYDNARDIYIFKVTRNSHT